MARDDDDRQPAVESGRVQTRNGRPYPVTIDVPDAAVKLCYTEFSTSYTMAVAGLALKQGVATCEVYRAGDAAKPRTSGTHLEGPGSAAVQSWKGIEGITTPRRRSSFQQGRTVITRYGHGSG
jgi:hypothetical protein